MLLGYIVYPKEPFTLVKETYVDRDFKSGYYELLALALKHVNEFGVGRG